MNLSTTPSHRIGECLVKVIDKNGNPVSDKDLVLNQKSHEFLFGCGAFDFLDFPGMQPNGDRRDKWLALMNYGTLPFYWGRYEPEEGHPNYEMLKDAADRLVANNVTLKGHPLCWHTVCADWLLKYSDEVIMDKQLARINRDVTAFKGTIDIWDVINEVVIMPIFDKYDNAVTRICNKYGRVTLVKEVFAAARAANPDGTFLINDFNTSPQYEKLLEELLDAGVEISAIGIQSHQHQGYWGEAKLRDVLKRFSRFGLPIHFTENTLISGEIMPAYIEDLNDWQVDEWPTTEEGELRQEKEWEEMYRILFADPNIKAITGWDFADGAWLNAPSGLITKDNRCKPVYNKLLSLVKGEWWTKDEVIHTNSDGIVNIKGTKGTYGIDGAEGVIKIGSEPSNVTVTI
ncbi:MAG: endo-1,4-beta-xylanase [Eubacteriales bacterium]|nr:endo-1,4-beta-xylanase [Clostridiales bacterium]MDO4420689.1 endo-1,4-beta-xylanase [Eubacteriales bacterium]